MADDHVRSSGEVVADLFAPEVEGTPAELRQRVERAGRALEEWAGSVPAGAVDEALAAGFDLESLTRP